MNPTTTLQVSFVSESAGYQNTFGWYNKVTGLGGVLFADVETAGHCAPLKAGVSTASFTVDTADLANIEYFLIPDGAGNHKNDSDDFTGPIKVIQLANGSWAIADVDCHGNVITSHGKPDLLFGDGANALFSETAKNAGGVDYASSTVGQNQTAATLAGDTADGPTGLLAWEDQAATHKCNGTYSKPGDADYNDAVFRISVVNSAPVAKADAVVVGEDAGATTINVLANDTDPNAGDTLHVAAVNASGILGTVAIVAGGQGIVYTPAAAFQSLGAGQSTTETLTYTVADQAGATSSASVTITVTGSNDAATVSSQSVSLTEGDSAAALSTHGQLVIADPDAGQAHVVAQTNVHGIYGDFAIGADGAWTYAGNGAHDELTAGQQVQDVFTVHSQDGTAAGTVTVTITGSNDAATVGSQSVPLTEGDSAAALSAHGQLAIADPDAGQAHVVAQTNVHGSYGDFAIAADGAWTYAGNGAHDELTANQQVQDVFTVYSRDGTAAGNVAIAITGSNDAAVIGTASAHDVTEDVNVSADGQLTASGSIAISDLDANEAAFRPDVVAAAGDLGSLSLAANGDYTYSVANSLVQDLGADDTRIDTFTVTALDGTHTGIQFTIYGAADSTAFGFTRTDYASGWTSESVTVGDVNGDGSPDLVVSNCYGSSLATLLNHGDGTFDQAVQCSVGFGPHAAQVADLNGDNIPDLITEVDVNSSIVIALGDGQGHFNTETVAYAGYRPFDIAVGDFNEDGKVDAVTNVGYTSVDGISVLLGNGDGTFQDRAIYDSHGFATGMLVVTDLNADHHQDIVITNYCGQGGPDHSAGVFLGRGDGTFQDATMVATGPSPLGVDAADFNNDGNTDLVVADLSSGLSILLGHGDGTFATRIPYAIDGAAWRVATGDINGDGNQDVVVSSYGSHHISLLLGNGDGTFQTEIDYGPLAAGNTRGLDVADLNGDGRLDIAVTNYHDPSSNVVDTVSALLNYGPGAVLAGTPGHDVFVFATPFQAVATITDFAQGVDELQVYGHNFGLAAGVDVSVTNVADHAAAAALPAGSFIFDNAGADAGTLFFDANGGSGADAVPLAHLQAVTQLVPSDFHVV